MNRLYFIALVPPEPLYGRITALKEEMRDRFGSAAALRSPPHITLFPPFSWEEEREKQLADALLAMGRGLAPFSFRLNGFDAFKPRVIFVRNERSEEMDELYRRLHLHLEETPGLRDERGGGRPFHPHTTIGFKDLTKEKFRLAWPEFENRPFADVFEAKGVALLKHDGRRWQVAMEAPFLRVVSD